MLAPPPTHGTSSWVAAVSLVSVVPPSHWCPVCRVRRHRAGDCALPGSVEYQVRRRDTVFPCATAAIRSKTPSFLCATAAIRSKTPSFLCATAAIRSRLMPLRCGAAVAARRRDLEGAARPFGQVHDEGLSGPCRHHQLPNVGPHPGERPDSADLAAGESFVIFADTPSPCLLKRLLVGDGGAAE